MIDALILELLVGLVAGNVAINAGAFYRLGRIAAQLAAVRGDVDTLRDRLGALEREGKGNVRLAPG